TTGKVGVWSQPEQETCLFEKKSHQTSLQKLYKQVKYSKCQKSCLVEVEGRVGGDWRGKRSGRSWLLREGL
ncbi:hypothetical protein ACQP3F_28880, partial [Escherichia coli]